MRTTVDVTQFVIGVIVVVAIADAALRTFVLPRPSGVTMSRAIAWAVRGIYELVARPTKTYAGRDRVMATYGPITLLSFAVVWLAGLLVGFALMYEALTAKTWSEAFRISGSALLTLGFAVPTSGTAVVLVFVEGAAGLLLVALLIAYLPTIYSAFSRREVAVTQLSVRAGTPPTPTELLIRAHRTGFTDRLDNIWNEWELWFVEVEETHTSLSILSFYRSPNPDRSWVTAAGAVLDAASIRMSTLDLPFSPNAAVCVRAGYLALREVASHFGVDFDPDPDPDDEISVTRDEFLDVYRRLDEAGVPLHPDREQAWRDFKGWRVNYDAALLGLAELLDAPYAQWISDRSRTDGRAKLPIRPRGPRPTRSQTIR